MSLLINFKSLLSRLNLRQKVELEVGDFMPLKIFVQSFSFAWHSLRWSLCDMFLHTLQELGFEFIVILNKQKSKTAICPSSENSFYVIQSTACKYPVSTKVHSCKCSHIPNVGAFLSAKYPSAGLSQDSWFLRKTSHWILTDVILILYLVILPHASGFSLP